MTPEFAPVSEELRNFASTLRKYRGTFVVNGAAGTRTNNGSQVLFIILVGVFGRLFRINSITYHDVVHRNEAHIIHSKQIFKIIIFTTKIC